MSNEVKDENVETIYSWFYEHGWDGNGVFIEKGHAFIINGAVRVYLPPPLQELWKTIK